MYQYMQIDYWSSENLPTTVNIELDEYAHQVMARLVIR